MQTRNGRRVMEIALVLCAMGTFTACAPQSRTSEIPRVEYPLLVNNNTDFQVVVYAMSSPTTRGARLGTARALGKTYLKIPDYVVRSQMFSVQLHAIGAPNSVPNWVSSGLTLNEDLMAQLDIHGDMSGNLRSSILTARLAKTYK
jgi:hypothetical protein